MRAATASSGKRRFVCSDCGLSSAKACCDYCGRTGPRLVVDNDPAFSSEVQARLDKAFEEIRQEAERRRADPLLRFPCKTCRHKRHSKCNNALVNGFSDPDYNIDWDIEVLGEPSSIHRAAKICGPEKALWEPHLPLWRRAIDWFIRPWR